MRVAGVGTRTQFLVHEVEYGSEGLDHDNKGEHVLLRFILCWCPYKREVSVLLESEGGTSVFLLCMVLPYRQCAHTLVALV